MKISKNPLKQKANQTLYDRDFALWIAETVNNLKTKQLERLDWENLIEEIESLGKKDRRELESRLTTLFEHALKRSYINLPDCYRGWELTIKRTQQELQRILKDSLSLQNYLLEIREICYQNSLENMRIEYDSDLPDINPFSNNIKALLTEKFW
jgi:hypothetical protein